MNPEFKNEPSVRDLLSFQQEIIRQSIANGLYLVKEGLGFTNSKKTRMYQEMEVPLLERVICSGMLIVAPPLVGLAVIGEVLFRKIGSIREVLPGKENNRVS